LRDDIAIVATHYRAVSERLHLELPTDPTILADVRRILRRWLHHHAVPVPDSREIVLAVSEVCANAIEHAYSPAPAHFELTGRRTGEQVEFVIRDRGAWRSPRGEHRGRGLKVVEAAMDEVEVRPSDSGTEVLMRRRVPA
jgi:anti-sigma regulatory factor (Ser/Thr protein kinase)